MQYEKILYPVDSRLDALEAKVDNLTVKLNDLSDKLDESVTLITNKIKKHGKVIGTIDTDLQDLIYKAENSRLDIIDISHDLATLYIGNIPYKGTYNESY